MLKLLSLGLLFILYHSSILYALEPNIDKEEAALIKQLNELENIVNTGRQQSKQEPIDISSRFYNREKSRYQQSQYIDEPYNENRGEQGDQESDNREEKNQNQEASRRPSSKSTPIFAINHRGSVRNGVTQETKFSIKSSCKISSITNYHHNNAKGVQPGTIALRSLRGKSYGPWQARATDASGKLNRLYWSVTPKITIPAGTYIIIDSDERTWSTNIQAKKRGITQVSGTCKQAQNR